MEALKACSVPSRDADRLLLELGLGRLVVVALMVALEARSGHRLLVLALDLLVVVELAAAWVGASKCQGLLDLETGCQVLDRSVVASAGRSR